MRRAPCARRVSRNGTASARADPYPGGTCTSRRVRAHAGVTWTYMPTLSVLMSSLHPYHHCTTFSYQTTKDTWRRRGAWARVVVTGEPGQNRRGIRAAACRPAREILGSPWTTRWVSSIIASEIQRFRGNFNTVTTTVGQVHARYCGGRDRSITRCRARHGGGSGTVAVRWARGDRGIWWVRY